MVHVEFKEEPDYPDYHIYDVPVDANGNWQIDYAIEERHLGVKFLVTAIGSQSHTVATTVFTDAQKTVTAITTNKNPAVYGEEVRFTLGVTREGGGGAQSNTVVGNLELYIDGIKVQTFPVSANSNTGKTYSTTSLSVGTQPHTIEARFVGSSASPGYENSTASLSQNISKAPLTVTSSNGTKIYGAILTNADFTGTLVGLKNGDNITVSRNSTGSQASASVSNYPIVATLSDPDNKLGNYIVSSTNGNLSITPASLVVTATAQTKVYGEALALGVTNVQTDFTTNGLVNGNSVTSITLASSGASSSAAVGNYTITPSAAVGTGLSNYTISYATTGILTITTRPITITADAKGMTYGDVEPPLTYQVTNGSLVQGDSFTGELSRTPGGSVGSYPINQGTVALNANYDLAFQPADFTINPKDAFVRADANGKTYGDSEPALTGELSGFLPADKVTATFTRTPGEDANGSYTISAALSPEAVLGNYNISTQTAAFTIAQKAITITATPQSKPYGTSLDLGTTAFSVTAGALVNGNTISAVALESPGALATAAATTAGSEYPITPSAATGSGLENYDISYAAGKLTVTKAQLEIRARDASKIYGEELSFLGSEVEVTGLIPNDKVESVTLTSVGAAATATVSAPGPIYAIVPTLATGTGLDNYSILYRNGTLTLSKAPATIALSGLTVAYDGQPKLVTATSTPAGIEGVELTYNGASSAPSTAGSYQVAATLTNPNYKLVNSSGTDLASEQATLTIEQLAPIFTDLSASQSITYGDASISLSGKLSKNGLAPTGSVSVAINSVSVQALLAADGSFSLTFNTASLPANTAAYTITYSYSGDTNFTSAADAATSLTVNKAQPVITWNNPAAIIYGALLSETQLNASASVEGTFTYLPAAGTKLPAGTHELSVTFTPTDATNYKKSTATATIHVERATPVLSWTTPANLVYGTLLGNNQLNASAGEVDGSFTYTPAAGTLLEAGPDQKLTVSFSPTDAANYTGPITKEVFITVDKAVANVQVSGYTGTYDGNPHGASGTATGINGTSLGSMLDLGEQFTAVPGGTAIWTFNGGRNYHNQSGSVSILLSKATATVAFNEASLNQTYNGTLRNALAQVTGATGTSTFTYTYDGTSTAPTDVKTGGYQVVATLVNNNYAGSATGVLHINKANLEVITDSKSKPYGSAFALADFTGRLSGNIAADNLSIASFASAGADATATVTGGPYAISATLRDPQNRLGNYTVISRYGNLTVTPKAMTITANSIQSVQYSDLVPAYTVSSEDFVNSETLASLAGTLSFTSTASLAANRAMLSGPGVYSIEPTGLTSSNYTITFKAGTLTVTPENAKAEYIGAQFVSTGGTTSSTATVVLRAQIQDVASWIPATADLDGGDIKNAKVDFIIKKTATDAFVATLSDVPVQLMTTGNTLVGVAQKEYTFNIGNETGEVYTIETRVKGFYTSEPELDNINIAKPSQDFITGGGNVSSKVAYFEKGIDATRKVNFGFNIKWNKSVKNTQGYLNLMLRSTNGTMYQFKATALGSLAVDASNPCSQKATFTCKANLNNATLGTNIEGNLNLLVSMADNGEPGAGVDKIRIEIWRGTQGAGGTLVFSASGSSSLQEVLLNGGNLSVRSGNTTCTTTVKATAQSTLLTQPTTTPSSATLTPPSNLLEVYPNPLTDQGTVHFRTEKAGKAQVLVFDGMGRQVAKLFDGVVAAGEEQHVQFKPQDLPSGFYICRLLTNGKVETRRITIQK
ncbi:MBG domain-containing protein [Hymenobacter seoulensis]